MVCHELLYSTSHHSGEGLCIVFPHSLFHVYMYNNAAYPERLTKPILLIGLYSPLLAQICNLQFKGRLDENTIIDWLVITVLGFIKNGFVFVCSILEFILMFQIILNDFYLS